MKIGVDIRVLMDKYYSGVSEYSANLLKAIFDLDTTTEYKLFYNSWHNLDDRLNVWNKKNAKIFHTSYPNKIFNYCLQKIFHYPKLDSLMGGVDIFWSPHFNFTSIEKGTKHIVTVHDLSFLRYPEFFSIRKNFWHQALAIKKKLRAADKIIAVSQNTKNDLIELLNIPEEKIQVIYSGNNAIIQEVSEFQKKDFLSQNKLNNRFILYLGNIEPRKNIIGLIEAYNTLRLNNPSLVDVQLVLAGANAWKNSKIYSAAQKSPYYKDILFLGYVDSKEKIILFKTATVFVYPSFYEGFGFPPLEALTYSLPTVCAAVSSLPEVVGDAALLVNPANSDEIAEAIEMIINDLELREILITKGLARAAKFTWKKTAQEYLAVFKSV